MTTIKDIALKTKLSTSTVSRILNEDLRLQVPTKTRQLVLETAHELGYIKKPRKSKIEAQNKIGLVMWTTMEREIEDPYYLAIRQGAEESCRKHQYQVVRIYQDDPRYQESLQEVQALICIGKYTTKQIKTFQNITKHLIFVDMDFNPITECHITLDFKNAIKEVIQTLTTNNHQRIGYLGGLEYLDGELYPDTRKKYFIEYCEAYHCDYLDYIFEDCFSSDSGYYMALQLLEKRPLPTAIFCANDLIAIGALKAFHDHQIRVPEDISVIGFDNINLVNYTQPPLSSILAPTLDMGNIAANIIIQSLQDHTKPPLLKIQLPCFLITRESVCSLD